MVRRIRTFRRARLLVPATLVAVAALFATTFGAQDATAGPTTIVLDGTIPDTDITAALTLTGETTVELGFFIDALIVGGGGGGGGVDFSTAIWGPSERDVQAVAPLRHRGDADVPIHNVGGSSIRVDDPECFGNAGGSGREDGTNDFSAAGAGGGGAGGPGANTIDGRTGGEGGPGKQSQLTGSSYAGGGAGGRPFFEGIAEASRVRPSGGVGGGGHGGLEMMLVVE